MERRRTFSREFKLEAVKLVTERGVTVAQAAKDLDVHENVLRKWVRELREAPKEAFPGNGKQTAQDAEIARLRKEVAKLKMERDILKKAALDSTRRCTPLIQGSSEVGIHGEIGTSRVVGYAEARVVGSMEGWRFHQRHRPRVVQASGLGAWGTCTGRWHLSSRAQARGFGLDDSRA